MAALGRKVPGEGASKAKILVLGEAPGREEELAGKPFVGLSGQLLRSQMLAAGLNPNEVWFTNVCKYRPPENQIVRWFDPKTGLPNSTILDGLAELREEIEAVDPTIILALGNTALWAVADAGTAKWRPNRNPDTGQPQGWSGIGDWRGSVVAGNEPIAGKRKLVSAYHPAAVARKWPWRVYLDLDIKRAIEQSASPELPDLGREIVINPQGDDRVAWRDRLLADPTKLLFFDIEYINSQLLCVSFCNSSDAAVVIPTTRASDIAFVRSILESGQPLGAQNGMFDCSVLEHWYRMSLFPNLKYDTMLASHAAYIELPKDLGTLCSMYTLQPCYWNNIDWSVVKKNPEVEGSKTSFLEYNGIDSWVTHEVAQCQQADELTDPAVRKTFEFEMSLIEPLWAMSKRGIKVDKAKLDALRLSLETEIAEKGQLLDYLNGGPLNVKSAPAMRKFLYDTLGFKRDRKTKAGADATDDKTLANLATSDATQIQTTAISTIRLVRKDRTLISNVSTLR